MDLGNDSMTLMGCCLRRGCQDSWVLQCLSLKEEEVVVVVVRVVRLLAVLVVRASSSSVIELLTHKQLV